MNMDDANLKRILIDTIKRAKGLHWWHFQRCRSQRSLAQNCYWWGVVIKTAQAAISEAWGENLSDDETHVLMREAFLRRPVVDRNTGEVKAWITPSSTELDTKEFGEFIEKAVAWLAETFGVVVPPADTYRGMEAASE